MKKNTIAKIAAAALLVTPVVSFAALQGLKSLLTDVSGILGQLKGIVFGLALLYFFWGMGRFILHSGDPKAKEEGKMRMIWGVIAMFVLISIFGIIGFIGNLLGIDTPVNGSSQTQLCDPAVTYPDSDPCAN